MVAAYLGAVMGPAPDGLLGAAICLVAIFLPGFLLLLAALPFLGQPTEAPDGSSRHAWRERSRHAARLAILGMSQSIALVPIP